MADCYLIHMSIDDSSFDGKFFRRVFNILASMDDDELKLLNYKRAIDFVNRLKIDKEDKNNTINLLKLLNNGISTESYLSHHGILGQKWGIRRYQNKDGSYTEAGKKKRLIESQKESYFNKASPFKVKTKTGEVLDIEPIKEWSALKEFGMNLIGSGSKDTMGRRGDANYNINKNGEKIGELSLINKNYNTAYGDWITIDEKYRGRGYARDILEDVISKARDAGYSRFEINALKKPRPLYERIGFKYADDLSLFDKIAGFEVGAKRMVYNLKDTSHFDKTDYLVHWGIKGQKWGIRRYQNEDGTYTDLGKKRRNMDSGIGEMPSKRRSVKDFSDEELTNRVKRLNQEKLYRKLSKEEKEESPNTEEAEKNFRKINSGMRNMAVRIESNQVKKNKAKALVKTQSDLSSMSDEEIRRIVNRLSLEEQYQAAMSKRSVAKGKIYASDILDTIGDLTGIAGGIVGVALIAKQLKKG